MSLLDETQLHSCQSWFGESGVLPVDVGVNWQGMGRVDTRQRLWGKLEELWRMTRTVTSVSTPDQSQAVTALTTASQAEGHALEQWMDAKGITGMLLLMLQPSQMWHQLQRPSSSHPTGTLVHLWTPELLKRLLLQLPAGQVTPSCPICLSSLPRLSCSTSIPVTIRPNVLLMLS